MASGAMADQIPNIRISSSGGAENPDSYSNNHVEVDFITPKVKARGPAEGAVTFAKYSTRLTLLILALQQG